MHAIEEGFVPLNGGPVPVTGPRFPLRRHLFPLQALGSPYGGPF